MTMRFKLSLYLITLFPLLILSNSEDTIFSKDKCGKCDTIININDTFLVKFKCNESRYIKAIIKNDKYNGLFLAWDKTGRLRSRIQYCMDKFCGEVMAWDSLGNILTEKYYNADYKPIGLHRIYYSANRPKQFTHYNDSGQKHGWEVSWYDNGNVKDSTLYQNDTLIRGKIFYYNGGLKSVAENVNNRQLYSASSYSPTGQKTGTIRNGTGIIYSCDSLGNNCHRIVYRDGKYIYNESD